MNDFNRLNKLEGEVNVFYSNDFEGKARVIQDCFLEMKIM